MMNAILRSYILSRLQPALCAVGAAWAWDMLFRVQFHMAQFAVVFLTTLAVYKYNQASDSLEDGLNVPAPLTRTATRLRRAIALLSCLASLWLTIHYDSVVQRVLVVGCFILALFYSGLGIKHEMRLKRVVWAKNFASAIGWTMLTVLYPIVGSAKLFAAPTVVAAILNFLGLMIIELIWDIRDARGDAAAKVITIPIKYGYRTTVRICVAANVAYTVVASLAILFDLVPRLWTLTLLNTLLVWVWLSGGRKVHESWRWSHAFQFLELVGVVIVGVLALELAG